MADLALLALLNRIREWGIDRHDATPSGALAGPRRRDSFGTTPTQGAR